MHRESFARRSCRDVVSHRTSVYKSIIGNMFAIKKTRMSAAQRTADESRYFLLGNCRALSSNRSNTSARKR